MILTISNREKIDAEFYFLLDPTKSKKFSKTILGIQFNFNHEPYYCGIGLIGLNRPTQHFQPGQLTSKQNMDKINKINSLISQGFNPRKYIIKISKELSEAINLEIEAIKIFGRKDKGTGILLNHSNGGEWHQSKLYSPYLEERHNEKTILICEKLNNNEELTLQEKRWVKQQKQSLKWKRGGIVPESSLKLIKKYQQPELFTIKSDEELSNEKTHLACQWIKKNKRNPNVHSKDNEERYFAAFINSRRQAKIGNTSFGNWYDSDLNIIISYGLPDLFTIIDDEQIALQKAKEVFDWRDSHSGQIPKYHSDNKQESQLGAWVIKQTQIFNDTNTAGTKHPSILKMEKERGYNDTFKVKYPEGLRKYDKSTIIKIWKDSQRGIGNKAISEKYDVPLHVIKRIKNKSGIYGKILENVS